MANAIQREEVKRIRAGISCIRRMPNSEILVRNSVVANFATTATDGKEYQVDYYNLDIIISVGYREKSLRGTQFRQWATKRLNEYIRKGFTMDDERPNSFGSRYAYLSPCRIHSAS